MAYLKRCVFLCGAIAFLAGCGEDESTFSVSTDSISFTGIMDANPPRPEIADISIHGDERVYLGVFYSGDAIEEVYFSITGGRSASIAVATKEPNTLGAGAHFGEIVIVGCKDENCEQEVKGSPQTILVSYTVKRTLSTEQLDFVAFADGVQPAAPQILEITPLDDRDSWSVDAVPTYPEDNPLPWLSISPSSGNFTGVGSLTFEVDDSLPVGFYTAQVELRVTPEKGFWRSHFAVVTYTVKEPFLVQSSALFSITSESSVADLSQAIPLLVPDGAPEIEFDASTNADWLHVSPNYGLTGNTMQLVLELDPEKLANLENDDYNARVNVASPGTSGVDVDVRLELDMPSVESIEPSTTTADRSGEIVLRGSGFNSIVGHDVVFGDELALSTEVVNDREIRAVHPALVPGDYPVRIDGLLAFHRSDAVLHVLEPVEPATAGYPLDRTDQ